MDGFNVIMKKCKISADDAIMSHFDDYIAFSLYAVKL